MKEAYKYILAAKLLCVEDLYDKEYYCCYALQEVNKSCKDFNELFQPTGDAICWFGTPYDEKNQLARSLALLFMAEIENDSDNL